MLLQLQIVKKQLNLKFAQDTNTDYLFLIPVLPETFFFFFLKCQCLIKHMHTVSETLTD